MTKPEIIRSAHIEAIVLRSGMTDFTFIET